MALRLNDEQIAFLASQGIVCDEMDDDDVMDAVADLVILKGLDVVYRDGVEDYEPNEIGMQAYPILDYLSEL